MWKGFSESPRQAKEVLRCIMTNLDAVLKSYETFRSIFSAYQRRVAPRACMLSKRAALTAELRAIATSLDHAKHQVRCGAAQYTARTGRDLFDLLCTATCRKRASDNWHCYSTQCIWQPCECMCKSGRHSESVSEYRSSSWARSNFHRDFIRLGKFCVSGLSGKCDGARRLRVRV